MRRLLFLWVLVCSGCGSVSPDKACTDAATALCNKLQSCASALVTVLYGDVATCVARGKLGCLPSLMAPSTSASPDKLDSCANATGAISCGALFSRDAPPPACKTDPGKLANGTACGEDAQCTSAFCKKTSGQPCGVCGARAPAGGACAVSADCDYGLACGNQLCVAYGMAGSSCDGGHPCAAPNVCKAGVCAAGGSAGQACDPAARDCDPTQPLFCSPTSRVCTTVTFAAAGQPCGFINGGYVACSAAGHCRIGTGFAGTCVAPAADGTACDTTNGPDCMGPATCVGGLCKLPNPASCT